MDSAVVDEALVIGEALVDVVREGTHETIHPGGSPANVALGLARRGRPTALLTRVGSDPAGELIVNHLKASGVRILPQSISARATSSATAEIQADGSASYEFDIHCSLPETVVAGTYRVIHTGSIAAFVEPGGSRLASYLDRLAPSILTFDPNVRPALLGSQAEACKRFEEIATRATVIKMSDEDAGFLYPHSTTEAVLDRVHNLGPALGIVTMGSRGSMLSSREGRVVVPAPHVAVVDTIGAGDTYTSAIIDNFAFGRSALDRQGLLRLGQAAAHAAAVTVSRAGANLPWATEISLPSTAYKAWMGRDSN